MAHSQEYFLGRKSAKQALDEAAEEWNAIVEAE
jgi:ABC-type glycerol-3-phosphate transport system substrate-binding protein